MASRTTIDEEAHPAPHRERISLNVLLAALFAPPLAWSIHLVVNYAVSSSTCYPDGSPLVTPTFGWLWPMLLLIDGLSLVISAASMAVAAYAWQASRQEMAETHPAMAETGEGRTRFLAAWGNLSGAVFFVLVAFDVVGLWMLPICG
jgi:hypothetical protein